MKIGLVLSRPPAPSETFFRSKILGLQEKGHQVVLFVEHHDRGFKGCPQSFLPVPGSFQSALLLFRTILLHPFRTYKFLSLDRSLGRSWFDSAKNLIKCLHLLNADALDWIHFGFASMAVGRESVAKAMGTRMGISLRGFDISRFPLRNPGVYRFVWKCTDRVHAISQALYRKAINDGLQPGTEIRIIHPAIDTKLFNAAPASELFPERVQLLTVARLHWTKGFEYTLDALSSLKKAGHDFHYTIVGDGKDLERYVFAAHQFGISDQVTFSGKVKHEELILYYQKAHIYIQYSVQEGFCNAALEAQSMGLPCIVSDAEGLPENVLHGKTGWVVPRRRPDLLATQLQEVITMNAADRYKICSNAVSRVKEKFDLENQKKGFVEFFS